MTEDIKKTLAKVIKFEDDTKESKKSSVRVVEGVSKDVKKIVIEPFTQ